MAAVIESVRQSVEVPLSADEAFELFTSGIAEWWPYKTHFSRGPVETLIFEPRLGGELKEVCSDGVVATYGRVLVWDPAELAAPLAGDRAARIHAVAAALCGQAGRRAAARALRTLPSGWRNVPSQPQRVTFECDAGRLDVGYRVGADPFVEVGGERLDVTIEHVAPGSCELIVDGIRRRYLVDRDQHVYDVDSPLGYTRLHQLTRFPERGATEAPGSLHAPMPGIVVRIFVEVGQQVDEGQDLLVLEAMKMEHRIRAPHAGVVSEIPVSQGDSIAAGTVLAVIEGARDE